MYSNESLLFNWIKAQEELIEYLLITGAPYWDILEFVTSKIKLVNTGFWYVEDTFELAET